MEKHLLFKFGRLHLPDSEHRRQGAVPAAAAVAAAAADDTQFGASRHREKRLRGAAAAARSRSADRALRPSPHKDPVYKDRKKGTCVVPGFLSSRALSTLPLVERSEPHGGIRTRKGREGKRERSLYGSAGSHTPRELQPAPCRRRTRQARRSKYKCARQYIVSPKERA